MTKSGLLLQVKPVKTGYGKGEGGTQELGEGILPALAYTEFLAPWEANQSVHFRPADHLPMGQTHSKVWGTTPGSGEHIPPPYGVTCTGLSTEEGSAEMASAGAVSLGRYLGGGGGCPLLLDGGLQQLQLLGQTGINRCFSAWSRELCSLPFLPSFPCLLCISFYILDRIPVLIVLSDRMLGDWVYYIPPPSLI